ncbi:MAG TPA: multidrug transporter [Alphaproteobacteria bacterium]|nr:multidrug transporter [Alphaproteobacteria bacterium]
MIAWYNLLLIIISTMIGAVGALTLKNGAMNMRGTIIQKILNFKVWLGLFLYGLASLIAIFVLLKENVSLIYPLTAMSYIWVILLSKIYLKENINAYKILAIIFIILGVTLLTI